MFTPQGRYLQLGNSRLRPALFVIATLTLCQTPAALGQLRNGKVERQLYQAPTEQASMVNPLRDGRGGSAVPSNRPVSRSSKVKADGRNHNNKVVAASYTSQGAAQSILVPSVNQPSVNQPSVNQPSGIDSSVSPNFALTSSMPDVGAIPSVVEHQGFYSTADCGCDSCGEFARIAPTCTKVFPPGCGPLMSIWSRLRVRGEAAMYWRRAAGPPPLVTTSPVGTAPEQAGELGLGTTTVLLGDDRLNEDLQLGSRITVSTWLDAAEEFGIQARYWNAGDQDDLFRFDSSTHEILARPFFNTTVAGDFEQDTQLVAFPGDLSGGIAVESTSSVEGFEIQLRRRLYQDRFTRVDWISGYQHVSIDEGLVISSTSAVIGTDNTISVFDEFLTDNSFHGGSYGFVSTRNIARWKMETMFRLGLGNLRREVAIAGATTTSGSGTTTTVPGGLLARSTNSRHFTDDTFVVLPEVGFNLAYNLRPGWDFTAGYNYMFIPKVAQASQQINDDLASNLSSPLTGQLDPVFSFDERNYWLHSLGLGLQVRY